MEKIFLISSNDGGFEPQNYVLGYKTSEDEAKAAVEDLKDGYTKARVFNHHLNSVMRVFEDRNASTFIRQNLVEVPRWPSGIAQNAITQEMRQERNDIVAKNQKTIEENSKAYAEWQLKRMEFIKPTIDSVSEEPWFKQWFDVGERYVNCTACGRVEGHEFIYEECEELK